MRLLSLLMLVMVAPAALANPIDFGESLPHQDPPCNAATRKRDGETCAVCKHKRNDAKLCDERYQNTSYHFRCDTTKKDGTVEELWCGKPDRKEK